MITSLSGIAIRTASRAPMQLRNSIFVTFLNGLEGDFRGSRSRSKGERQVTLISEEQWLETCAELGTELPWHARRANLCVRGMWFDESYLRTTLLIGDGLMLEVMRRMDPCFRMDEIHPGLQAMLDKGWRCGVTCRVRQSGVIRIGDPVI